MTHEPSGQTPDIGGANEVFRLAFEHAPIGIVVVAPDGPVRWANRAICEMLGRTSNDLVGEVWDAIVHPDDLDVERTDLRRVLASGGTSYTIERRCIRSDGSVFPSQIDVSLIFDDAGNHEAFVAHVQDISERKATHDQLERAHQALQASQQRSEALVERSTDIICIIDVEGMITYHSPAAERVLGWPPDTVGVPFGDIVHPDDRAKLVHAFRELLREPSTTTTAEARVIAVSGDWRHVEIVATNRVTDPAVGGVVANVRDVTERVDAASRITWQAFHDPLTGLPNRALLNDRLAQAAERARRAATRCAVLFLDLDHFKLVNDSLGHEAGDELLVEVARRLTRTVRGTDTVARLGGDEFVVLVEGSRDEEVLVLADRLAREVAEPISLPQGVVNTSTSIGIAFGGTERVGSHLLRDADTALYRAKEKGRNRFHVFTESLRAAALRRVEIDQGLRAALAEERLRLHVQPIADLTTGDLLSVEALMRVQDRHGNLELPAEYLEVADESGLVVAVGQAMLEQACRAMVAWRSSLGDDAPPRIAVNVAARELASQDFLPHLWKVLARYDLSPPDLALEFTESTVIGADRQTLRTVDRLKEVGVTMAVDDFGTGYSSLAYLKRFPIGAVKLDRTFVAGLGTDPSDAEIVRAVVSLGEALELDVVAEGIETPGQLQMLQELGCSYGQGFLLGPPAAPECLDPSSLAQVIADTNIGWAVS